jgi:hypothetical protein
MSLTGFELVIPASEQPQTHALVRTATKIGLDVNIVRKYIFFSNQNQQEPYLMDKQFYCFLTKCQVFIHCTAAGTCIPQYDSQSIRRK